MSLFTQLIKAIQPMFRSQKDLDDQYLADAVSVYDLERRMRAIDQRGHLSQDYPAR